MTTTDTETTAAVRHALSRTSVEGVETDLLDAVVEEVDVHGARATVAVDPDHDRDAIRSAVEDALASVPAVETVDVEGATDSAVEGTVESVEAFDRVIAVASAKGGVGKSTVATNLACALAGDREVAVFDADIHGPNVPRLFDVEGPVRADDEDRPMPVTYEGIEVMSVGLLESGAPLAWRGAMAHEAVSDLLGETAWSTADTLVIDLPPGTGDVVLTTLQEVPVDGLVVVTTPFHTAVADTNRTVELFRDEGVPVLGAVVNMAEFTCECCGEPNALFEDAVADLDAEVLARLPFDRQLQGRPAPGEVPGVMVGTAGAVAEELDAVRSFSVPEAAVDIRGLPPAVRKEYVREAFEDCAPGERFVLASDRDPTPVRAFLADLAGVDPEDLAVDVERKTPETWLLRTTHP